jgi:predicted metalloprotease
MAFWDKIGSVGDIEDRRGTATTVGGLGILGIIVLLVGSALGINLDPQFIGQLIQVAEQVVPQQTTKQANEFQGKDQYEVFASKVIGSNNDYWTNELTRQGTQYTSTTLVLFRNATRSGCGVASSQVGPHYCPADQKIYLDETFFDALTSELGAKGGDVAQAYVISHEVGHHVQNLLGQLDDAQSSNEASIRAELQADCYAGLWANSANKLGIFESNMEINEAIDAAGAVGDDRIQEKVEGRINPENWTHGSAAERIAAFSKGYKTGEFFQCQ